MTTLTITTYITGIIAIGLYVFFMCDDAHNSQWTKKFTYKENQTLVMGFLIATGCAVQGVLVNLIDWIRY